MQFIESTEVSKEKLDAFKARNWPNADVAHYGDGAIDFTYYEHTIVLTDDSTEEIVGYAKYTVELGVCRLDSVIVDESRRGKGYASALVCEVERRAREIGAHRIILETGCDWDARFLYPKLDYELLVTIPRFFGKKDFLVFTKEL